MTENKTKEGDEMHIQIGDYFLVTTKNDAEYDGQIIALNQTTLTIEHWNEVKDRLDETIQQLRKFQNETN